MEGNVEPVITEVHPTKQAKYLKILKIKLNCPQFVVTKIFIIILT